MISSVNLDPLPLPANPSAKTAPPANAGLRTPPNKLVAGSKLQRAAGEFESMLLSNLWKSMKSTFTSDDSDDTDSTDPAKDSFDQMGIDAMSSAVGKAGGLGLGRLILNHLEPKHAPPLPVTPSNQQVR